MRRLVVPAVAALAVALAFWGAGGALAQTAAPSALPLAVAVTGSAVSASGNAVLVYGRRSVCATEAPAGLAGPCGGAVLESVDGGRTWRTVWRDTDRTIEEVSFATAQAGYVVATSDRCGFGPVPEAACGSVVLATEDGGRSWTQVVSAANSSVDLTATARGVVWAWLVPLSPSCATASARCPLEILRSTAIGAPWRVVERWTTGALGASGFAHLRVDGHVFGWTVAGDGTVLESRDGGRRWRPVGRLSVPRGVVPLVGTLDFATVRDGWLTFCDGAAVGNGGCPNSLYVTHDGGRTWSLERTTGCINWMAVHMRNTHRGVLVTGGATTCQRPHDSGSASPATGTAWDSNVLYGTDDGGHSWRRLARVPAVLSSASWSQHSLWLTATTCAYDQTGMAASCRSFVARVGFGPDLVPVYPAPALPLGATALPDGRGFLALTMSPPDGPLEVWLRRGTASPWRAVAHVNGLGPGELVTGFGALPGVRSGWWLSTVDPQSGRPALWTGAAVGRLAHVSLAPPGTEASAPFVVTGSKVVWTIGCTASEGAGCHADTLYRTADGGRAWQATPGPTDSVILAVGADEGEPVVIARLLRCPPTPRAPVCTPRLERFTGGHWRLEARLPAAAAGRRPLVLAVSGGRLAFGYVEGRAVRIWQFDAGAERWLALALPADAIGALPFGSAGPGLVSANSGVVVPVGASRAGVLALP